MAKKTARIKVGLICTETGTLNYVTEINKLRPEILKTEPVKYSPLLRRRSKHKYTKKLD